MKRVLALKFMLIFSLAFMPKLESNKQSEMKILLGDTAVKPYAEAYPRGIITKSNPEKKHIKKVSTSKNSLIEKEHTVSKIEKLNVVENLDLRLSYTEVEEQKKIKIETIPKVVWNTFKIKDSDYSIKNNNFLAKEKTYKVDRISTKASANEKSTSQKKILKTKSLVDVISQKSVLVAEQAESTEDKLDRGAQEPFEVKVQKSNEELVFFEYSPEGNVSVAQLPGGVSGKEILSKSKSPKIDKNKKVPMSNKLRSDIRRVGTRPSVTIQNTPSQRLSEERANSSAKDTKEEENKNLMGFIETDLGVEKDMEVDYSCLGKEKLQRKTYKSTNTISLDSINYTDKSLQKIHQFEIRFQDDIDEIVRDHGDGFVKLELNLNTQMNIRRASIYASGHYPTSVDLVFEGGDANISIPMFEISSFDKIINESSITGLGASLLIELDETTEDIDINVETKYEDKLYLNENLKPVDRSESNFMYILFLGVAPGNTLVYFKDTKNIVSSKMIHLTEKEIYYDPNFYANVLDDSFQLYEENLLSECKGMLNISEEEITPLGIKSKTNKKSLNEYSLEHMIYPLGTRKYYELSHLSESLFIGRWSESAITVPTEDYINHVMSNFEINQNECLVQVNLTKKLKESFINAQSGEGNARVQLRFLDEDGSFYEDVSDSSGRIFIVAEDEGIINIKLNYIDGSSQYLQSFCMSSMYLIEQL